MATPILTTKLFVPPLRADALLRARLIERLDGGTANPLTLISAAAGSGKSTLLCQWLVQRRQPAAWLSLDPGDNDPNRLFSYIIAALRAVRVGIGEAAEEIFEASSPGSLEPALITLINEIAEVQTPLILVLDDYHNITDPRANRLMTFFIEHLPPNFKLVIASRIDPPWPLSRYRARNQLLEIRGLDLRFRREEVAQFLSRCMGLELSAAELASLEERTEGWIAGLQLAGLSMKGRGDIPAFVESFAGSHLIVADYLIQEILDQQPEPAQTFLLRTSILHRLSSGLCAAVSGIGDAQAILYSLHRSNAFVIPLDDEGHWYRYHHLFADLLQTRLTQRYAAVEIAGLHTRAAGWYEDNGQIAESVDHIFAAGDMERAAILVDRAAQSLNFSQRYTHLKPWLDRLPEDAFKRYPRLEIHRLLIDLGRGTVDMYEETLRQKEKLVRSLPVSPENDLLRREAMVSLANFYAHQNSAHAIEIAQEALDRLPEDALEMRAYLHSVFYRAYGMEGDITRSAPAYRECFRLAKASGQYGMVANTSMVRAFDLCQYGRLDEAAGYCQQIIDAAPADGRAPFYPAGPAYIGLAGIHLERNQLVQAEGLLTKGLDLCRQGAIYGMYTGYIQQSRLLQAQGKLEQSAQVLQQLEQNLQRRDFTFTARQVALRLAQGDVVGAASLEGPLMEIFQGSVYAQRLPLIAAEAFKLNLARIYLARGESLKTCRLLDEIQATVEPGQRFGRLLEVCMLRALTLRQMRGSVTADGVLDNIERALDLGERPGFVMLFLEEGPPLVPLLNAVFAGDAPARTKGYARKLLLAFAAAGTADAETCLRSGEGLVEPLTAREAEVLALIASGDNNQTIADKLFISVRTVKKHVSNIFGKLNVSSRTQAVAQSRGLGLLPPD